MSPWSGPWVATGLYAALALGAAIGAYAILAFLLHIFQRSSRQTAATWDDALFRFLDPSMPLAGALFVFAAALRASQDRLVPEVQPWLRALTTTGWAFLAAFALTRLVEALLSRHVENHPQRAPMVVAARRAAIGVLWGVTILVVLGSLGIEVTPIVASLGIGGIALALALQDSLQNFFAGLWMRSTKDIRRGHFIRIEDAKVEGNVERMGWRTTRIKTRSKNVLIVPNGVLARSVITNYHLPDPKTQVELELSTSFDSDPEAVRAVLLEAADRVAQDLQGLLLEPKPHARLSMGNKGLRWTLRFYLVDISLRNVAKDALLRRIVPELQARGVRLTEP